MANVIKATPLPVEAERSGEMGTGRRTRGGAPLIVILVTLAIVAAVALALVCQFAGVAVLWCAVLVAVGRLVASRVRHGDHPQVGGHGDTLHISNG